MVGSMFGWHVPGADPDVVRDRIAAQLRAAVPQVSDPAHALEIRALGDAHRASPFIVSIEPRDADAPSYYDFRLDIDRLMRQLRGEPCVDRLCRKMDMTCTEVLRHFTPGAYVEPNTGEVSLNAGYDPGFDEGLLEVLIWAVVGKEVSQIFADHVSAGKATGP